MAGRSRTRALWLNIFVSAIVIGIIGWILRPQLSTIWHAREAQRELVAFTSELKLGMSQADVRARLKTARTTFLVSTDVDPSLTFVETPLTFGAGNWVAWLDFTRGQLSSVRIRITDGQAFKPEGSPPDVGVPPPPRR
jgi:hypothetical protein